jgi:hypothetical protein
MLSEALVASHCSPLVIALGLATTNAINFVPLRLEEVLEMYHDNRVRKSSYTIVRPSGLVGL